MSLFNRVFLTEGSIKAGSEKYRERERWRSEIPRSGEIDIKGSYAGEPRHPHGYWGDVRKSLHQTVFPEPAYFSGGSPRQSDVAEYVKRQAKHLGGRGKSEKRFHPDYREHAAVLNQLPDAVLKKLGVLHKPD